MKPAYFVTGTGTDIGKTFISTLLLRASISQGKWASAFKPVMSGVQPGIPNDASMLLQAQGAPVNRASIAAISPFQFAAPLSPHIAAHMEGRLIDPDSLLQACQTWMHTHKHNLKLIEGAGGLMVPISPAFTTLDWIAELGLPVILVCGDYLGAMSHTLTALTTLSTFGLPIKAVIINQSADSVGLDAMCETIRDYGVRDIPVVPMGRIKALQYKRYIDGDSAVAQQLEAEHKDFFTFAASL